MSALLLILLSAVLVSHYAPALLGSRVFEESDAHSDTMGVAAGSMLLISVLAPLNYLIDTRLLRPLGLVYLDTFVLAIMIMTLVPLAGVLLQRLGSWTPVRPTLFLVLTCNSALLGIALLSAAATDLSTAVGSGIGLGLVFAFLLIAFQSLHARVAAAPLPLALRDAPSALVTVGLMALALMGLTGIVRD